MIPYIEEQGADQILTMPLVMPLAAPEVRDRIKSFGTEPLGNTPEEFAAQIRSDIVKWAKVARAANVRAD